MCAGHQGLEPSSPAFQDHLQGAILEEEQPGHKLALTWDASNAGGGLTHYAIMLASDLAHY